MAEIFICSRRDDAPLYVGRLYDLLAARFGAERVSWGVAELAPGDDFAAAVEHAVGSSEILIAIIGNDWLAADSKGRRRLDNPADIVRLEIATALARGIRVVPVLVDGAEMPPADQLPADLAPLTRRQALELSRDPPPRSHGAPWKRQHRLPLYAQPSASASVRGWDSCSGAAAAMVPRRLTPQRARPSTS